MNTRASRRHMIGVFGLTLFSVVLSSTAAVAVAQTTPEVSAQELKSWMAAAKKPVLIDVREDSEWQTGHAAAALHIPRLMLSEKIASAVPAKSARVVLYCRSGVRSAAGAAVLQKLGYTNVYSLTGGFKAYQEAGLPVQQ